MKNPRKWILYVVKTCLFLIVANAAFAQDSTFKILGEFEEGWEQSWFERKLIDKSTTYESIADGNNRVLMATSRGSASGLWHPLDIRLGKRGTISWRWKIEDSLDDDTAEKTKLGDDYVARLFVVFDPHFLSWKTRAICYVWSANQPIGTEFANPYSESVRMIVLQSGKQNKDTWIEQERSFVADYERNFGKEPEMVTAVALMVDTDNSHQTAIAWFDDIVLSVSKPETPSTNTRKRQFMPKF
ncbi:DUF3047 domain-containing protein [candidate division KSB1 bacterium]|nr:DUF3047 domain-containing protein [candidate division KSB1 bacterium]NIR68760.1 DUF3047 domain-containing protein [candidate division KSB1 bacterium]NIS25576.1 DUF3047 domain-containing protein [candidate division KSB1 bacterium]NIT72470.1 DUF3047 domain-containing protein [candidate division KSB1 bacterium]NIU26254.1 DUF3047 domain-containing protein [candidate division KSB1 bacterium]